jgi:hypothetical protein
MRLIIGLLLAVIPGFSADRSLPLFFFPNTGQTDASVQYVAQTPDLSARFRRESVVFQVHQQQASIRFIGGNPDVAIGGLDPLSAKINFFLGNTGWKKDVPSYSRIVYRGLYPGIDMTYGGTGRQVKSEFFVSPGANPALIRLEYSEPVSIDAHGNLLAGGDFREAAPEVYQQIGAERVKIAGRYRVLDAHTVGFEIGAYDVSAPLVIDPTITYCTYLGGSGTTAITGVAVDSGDNLYVTGWTEALNFPIDNAVEASNQGGVDVIVAKLNAAGTALIYATYIGGRSNDQGAGIAVDSLGQAYVTGVTSSSNFPLVLSNRGGIGGTTTAFALKLNATGNTLLYSGYLGGTVYDTGAAIAVDTNFNAYVSGTTQSSNFPTLNPTQASFGGGVDVFVTKLNSAGTITFSTFLGGSGNEEAGGIAVDSVGNIFVAGGTSSTNFPVVSPYQGTLAGSADAFVTKITFGGAVGFSTYLGGSGGSPQQASALALDSAGNPYITGVTTSSNFPVTSSAFQTVLNGLQNAFVAKLTNTGQTLVYSSYLGGSSYDWGYGIAINAAGDAYIAGATSSVDFPQVGAVQAAFNGAYDAFVTELNFGGTAVLFSTYYGGSGSDAANAIAVDINTNIFIGGQTSSSNLPLVAPIQSTLAASSSGWLLRLGVTAPPTTTPSVVSVSPTSSSGGSMTFTAQFADTGGGSVLTTAALVLNTSASTGSGCYVSYSPAMNLFSIYTDAGTTVLATLAPGTGSAQNDQCGLSGVGSSATVSGTTLTVTFSLSFLPAFAGSKTVYLLAADANSTTALTAQTSFTVTVNPGTPQVVSVSPNAGTGSAQTFTFLYSDTVIASNLSNVALLFNTSVNAAGACYVVYSISSSSVALISDSGVGSSSLPLGSSSTLQNSQCVIGTTSASVSGLSLTFTVAITFKGAFNGAKNIYMEDSTASLNSGFVQMGTYTVNAGGSPVAVSAVPGSGSGVGERFSFTVADPGGSGFINSAAILFASSLNMTNACYLIWDGTANTVSLTFNNPANGQTPFAPGATGVATNQQCTMNAANSTIVKGVTQVVITLDLTFNSTFFGPKNIYLLANEAFATSGWTTVGTWTVTGGAPTANSLSPSSGSGSLQTFTFTVSDSSSETNLTGMSILITPGSPAEIANACYVVFSTTVTTATIGLWDNTGNTTLSTKNLGSTATLQNSQCAVGSTVNFISGDSFEFQIQLQFNTTNFAGTQNIYLQANEPSANSGFVYQGTWTVP